MRRLVICTIVTALVFLCTAIGTRAQNQSQRGMAGCCNCTTPQCISNTERVMHGETGLCTTDKQCDGAMLYTRADFLRDCRRMAPDTQPARREWIAKCDAKEAP